MAYNPREDRWDRGNPLGRPLTAPLSSTRVHNLIIAIDGPAASGKSTTARLVADRLGYVYIDSGAMYRAAALRAIRLHVCLENRERLGRVAEDAEIGLENGGRGAVTLDGEDVTEAIRAPEVTAASSIMSTVPAVRRALVRRQREIGESVDSVVEGRDIGTVVFPDADLKIYLVASIEERARRRHAELAARGTEADLDAIAREIEERDRRDSTRTDSPLRRADDAVLVDTTGLSIAEQVDKVVSLAIARGARAEERGGASEH